MSFKKSLAGLVLTALLALSFLGPFAYAATPASTVKTTKPTSTFGLDAGIASWSFGTQKFSWASASSNMTLNLPTLILAVGPTAVPTTFCGTTLNWSLSHNSTTWIWIGVPPNAVSCGGSTLNPVLRMYVKNVTNAYNEKEIVITGTTTRTGTVTFVQNQVSFPLIPTAQQSSPCASIGCLSVSYGATSFDWSLLSAFTPTFNNSTNTLKVSSTSSSSGTITYVFDPLALDGSNKCAIGSGGSSCGAAITTTSAPDIIEGDCGINIAGAGSRHVTAPTATGLTFLFRASKALSTTNNITEWYAISNVPLSAVTITGHETANGLGSCSFFGISGADTVTIWDSHTGIPYSATGTNSVPTVSGISTNNAKDILIGMTEDAGTVTQTAGACCTLITSATAAPVTATEYNVVSSIQSGASGAFGQSTGAGNTWVMLVDIMMAGLQISNSATLSFTPAFAPKIAVHASPIVTLTLSPTFAPQVNVDIFEIEHLVFGVALNATFHHTSNFIFSGNVTIAFIPGFNLALNPIPPVEIIQHDPLNILYLGIAFLGLIMVALVVRRRK